MARKQWDNEYYVRAYRLACSGMSIQAIGKALGYNHHEGWEEVLETKPALRSAIKQGHDRAAPKGPNDEGGARFKDFAWGRLPERLKGIWDRIMTMDEDMAMSHEKILSLHADMSKIEKQRLWLYGFVHFNFNKTKTSRFLGITSRELLDWFTKDPDFMELLKEIESIKGDIFEESLVDLVKQGDVAATIFANKTFNRERGYGERKQIDIKGEIQSVQLTVNFEDLDLPLEVLKLIRQRIIEKGLARPALPAPGLDAPNVVPLGRNGVTYDVVKDEDFDDQEFNPGPPQVESVLMEPILVD